MNVGVDQAGHERFPAAIQNFGPARDDCPIRNLADQSILYEDLHAFGEITIEAVEYASVGQQYRVHAGSLRRPSATAQRRGSATAVSLPVFSSRAMTENDPR